MNNFNRRMLKVGCQFRQRTDIVFCFKMLQWPSGGSGRASPRRKEVHLESMAPGYQRKMSGASSPGLFLLEILSGAGIFVAGLKERPDREGRPQVWL